MVKSSFFSFILPLSNNQEKALFVVGYWAFFVLDKTNKDLGICELDCAEKQSEDTEEAA